MYDEVRKWQKMGYEAKIKQIINWMIHLNKQKMLQIIKIFPIVTGQLFKNVPIEDDDLERAKTAYGMLYITHKMINFRFLFLALYIEFEMEYMARLVNSLWKTYSKRVFFTPFEFKDTAASVLVRLTKEEISRVVFLYQYKVHRNRQWLDGDLNNIVRLF